VGRGGGGGTPGSHEYVYLCCTRDAGDAIVVCVRASQTWAGWRSEGAVSSQGCVAARAGDGTHGMRTAWRTTPVRVRYLGSGRTNERWVCWGALHAVARHVPPLPTGHTEPPAPATRHRACGEDTATRTYRLPRQHHSTGHQRVFCLLSPPARPSHHLIPSAQTPARTNHDAHSSSGTRDYRESSVPARSASGEWADYRCASGAVTRAACIRGTARCVF